MAADTPESLLDSRSEFDRAKTLLGRVLRDHAASVRALTEGVLSIYGSRAFIAGWSITLARGEVEESFHVLVDEEFPYSKIRVAYKTRDMYLTWPHVEGAGLLCLPEHSPPSLDIEQAAVDALSDSLILVEHCQNPDFVAQELGREFRSYWGYSKDRDADRVRSLLDTTNRTTRKVAVWYGKRFTLVGENADQLISWLTNIGGSTKKSDIDEGLFAYLASAPVYPFPQRPNDLFNLLRQSAPGAMEVLGRLPILTDLAVVLAASSETGDGQVALSIKRPGKFAGFRKTNQLNAAGKLALWGTQSELKRSVVERFDAPWVHGRGVNAELPRLRESRVLVLGCGSLGSQVASRLAQAGVGSLTLIDPEDLAAANVGRHELGVDSAGKNKAARLGGELREKYPHAVEIEAYGVDWQQAYEKKPELFEEASLIVACIGEWGPDGQLGEWLVRQKESKRVVFGWLDEYGVACHALALGSGIPALSCVLNAEGSLRIPETKWPGETLMQVEPACGTLFQPYGSVDVAQGQVLVSRLCIDLLIGKTQAPCHRVYAASTSQIKEAGGEWSAQHLEHRPAGFDGAFIYERPVARCGQCAACVKNAT